MLLHTLVNTSRHKHRHTQMQNHAHIICCVNMLCKYVEHLLHRFASTCMYAHAFPYLEPEQRDSLTRWTAKNAIPELRSWARMSQHAGAHAPFTSI